MSGGVLQIFLLVNVFFIGILLTIAVQHAYAHFRPREAKPAKPVAPPIHIPPELKQELLQKSADKFQKVLDQSAGNLDHDMHVISAQLNKQLERLGTEIVNDEMKRYRASLDELRTQASAAITGAQAEIEKHQEDLETKFAERQKEMEAKLQEEIAAEKQRLLAQIDTKLADAVASFLIETMQHNVDLGAQSAYLTSMLEEHKADFAKGVSDEA